MDSEILNKYLDSLFNDFKVQNSSDYNDPREPLPSRLYRFMNRSKIRSAQLSEEVKSSLREKIAYSIENEEPITLAYAMGIRGINTHNTPGVNWAEILHFKFFYDNFSALSEIFKPGMRVIFSPDDDGARILNNYTEEMVTFYNEELGKLIDYFNSQMPDNFTFELKPASDWYPKHEDIRNQVVEHADKMEEDKEKSDEIKKEWYSRAQNNLHLENPDLSAKEIRELTERSTILNMAWLEVDFENRKEFFEGGANIGVVHFDAFPGYQLKILPDSTIQFWKGNGYLKMKRDKVKSKVVSRRQWGEVEDGLEFVGVEDNPTGIEVYDSVPVLGGEDK